MLATPNFVRRLIVVGAAALFMLLLSGSQTEAGGRPMRAWTRLMFGFERVCKDGMRLAMADTDRHTYKLVFVEKGQGVPTGYSPTYAERSGITLEKKVDGEFSSPNCVPAPINDNNPEGFIINYCDGPISIYWNTQLPVGKQLDLYVYSQGLYGTYNSYDWNVFPLVTPWKGFEGLIVSDCNVDEAVVAITQTGPGSTEATVTDALVFQAHAYDPNWDTVDGAGIDRVRLKVVNASGVIVHENSPYPSTPKCVFQPFSSHACPPWGFQERGYRWPSGHPIQNGRLTLQATAYRRDGGSTTINQEVNVQLPPGARPIDIPPSAVAMTTGSRHTCALTSTGSVKCWGDNTYGQLGNGARASAPAASMQPSALEMEVVAPEPAAAEAQLAPAEADAAAAGHSTAPSNVHGFASAVAAISAGSLHTCALTSAGGVKCWGDNKYGQLGNDSVAGSSLPVDVQGLASGVAAISAGGDTTCALMVTGGVKCWGFNQYGQLGNDSTTNQQLVPVDVKGLAAGVTAISAGGIHTCAVLDTGSVKCWGYNGSGQLGSGAAESHVPIDVQGLTSGAVAISARNGTTCALTSGGGAKCWGDNTYGQLGRGTSADTSSVPVDVQALTSGVAALSVGGASVCALLSSGAVKCWGYNNSGQLGNGTRVDSSVAVQVEGLSGGIASVETSGIHACAVTVAGSIKCWGSNMYGALGSGSSTFSSTPGVVLGLDSGMSAASAGKGSFSCAVTAAGGVKCWGYNQYGQLGNGGGTNSLVSVDVQGLASGVTAVSTGINHACALTSAGGVTCWGHNQYGQLGSGSFASSGVPVGVKGLNSGVVALSAGGFHTCALTSAGGVKCWGYNGNGGLGNGNLTNSNAPVNVSGLSTGALAVSAGAYHTCAVGVHGDVRCWGFNQYGQLGNGTTRDSNVPIQVEGLSTDPFKQDSVAVSAGRNHTCAGSSTGSVKCWGEGLGGELGDGTFRNRSGPISVMGLNGSVVALSSGYEHTCALVAGGIVQCWGDNGYGRLGHSNGAHSAVAVAVPGLADGATAVSAGARHTCAVTGSEGVVCWGDNRQGELGNGLAGYRTTPSDVVHHNNYPAAVDDRFVVQAASAGAVLDVLANDTIAPDVGETLTIVAAGESDQGGSISVAGGVLTYTPTGGFVGDEHFTYTIDDGREGTGTATVTVSVVAGPLNTAWLFLPSIQR